MQFPPTHFWMKMHFLQVAPYWPQAELAVPDRHELPFQQPVQQLPRWHTPGMVWTQSVPSGRLVWPQIPPLQVA